MINHEMQHLVTKGHGVQVGSYSIYAERRLRELAALHEGVSDYFAAAITGDPHINEWFLSQCDNTPLHPGGPGRWLDSDRLIFKYSNFDNVAGCYNGVRTAHANSMILSGTMWDLRLAIGPVADQLFSLALDYLPTEPDFLCMADVTYQAAADFEYGQHSFSVLSKFLNRGIWGACPPRILGGDGLLAGNEGTFTATVSCPIVGVIAYTWSKRDIPPGSWQEIGWDPSISITEMKDYELKVRTDDAFSRSATTTRVVAVSPRVLIVKPPIVTAGQPATYSASITGGRAPFNYTWKLVPGPVVGNGETLTYASCNTFALRLDIQDANLRVAADQTTVVVQGTCGPQQPEATLALRGSGQTDPLAEAEFALPAATEVEVSVIDVAGRKVATAWKGTVSGQRHDGTWNSAQLSSGVYFYVARHAGGQMVRRFVIAR